MLRNSASAQPDLPPQHHRGSSYHISEKDHGYQSPRQHQRSSSSIIINSSSTIATPPRRENAFNAPRPSLLPYQEYHSGFTDDDLASSPLSSSSHSHRRQTSFPNLLPLAIRNRTPSPTRKTSVLAEEMPLTGDGRRSRPGTTASETSPQQRGGFAGWLTSTAAGNALDSLSMSRSDSRTPDATPTKLRKTQTGLPEPPSTPAESVSTRASRFMTALSTRLATTPAAHPAPAPVPDLLDNDELYNLDIESALFPPGSPRDRDAFSPAAFKNLQANALGLLGRFQAAYRGKVAAARDLEAERAAQRDELEEAVVRAEHLRMQLEGMARRAAEQEGAMRGLVEELVRERRGREEERLARERAMAAVAAVAGSMVSEDLGVDEEEEWSRRGSKRKSGGSGESWAETDEESVDESVFSRSRSPAAVEGVGSGEVPAGLVKSGSGTVRGRNSGQMSTFQKIFKNIAGDGEEVNGCRNCQGRDASVAWDTVSLLRDENRHLKQRVGQLEVAVEGALDMVNGLGL
ncbi:hypothetical protein BR93DRAFT_993254 [Coniochaeta sp. PMI_546]|nr:hypothetical protein BR93DRAFT_993254 [Coniochaeta sp. PMI_546]